MPPTTGLRRAVSHKVEPAETGAFFPRTKALASNGRLGATNWRTAEGEVLVASYEEIKQQF